MNYKVSIIIPVYNTEKYLDDAIKSIINQTYNFKKIELILVNDGSKDNSLDICNKYSSKYNNIITYDKKNTGVSDTRNYGLERARGSYIMFLDSDDCLNKDSIKYLTKFLDNNEKVDFVISRVRRFEMVDKWHFMDFRFDIKEKIINIFDYTNYSQYHSTGILIRKDALKDIRFDKDIKFGEDMKFMSQLLINNNLFGIEKRSILFYRQRDDESSAVQGEVNDKKYYLNILDGVYMFIINNCLDKYNEVPKYFQYFILHSISERFNMKMNFKILSKKEYDKYIELFKKIISFIDDDIIMSQTRIGINNKYDLLKLKHGNNHMINYSYKYKNIIVDDIKYNIRNSEFIKLYDMTINDDKIRFHFSMNDYLFKDNIKLYINDKEYVYNEINNDNYNIKEYYDIYSKCFYKDKLIEIEYDYNKINSLKFKIDNEVVPFVLVNEHFNLRDYRIKYWKIKKVLINFRESKGEIVFRRKYSILRDIKFKMHNIIYFYTKGDHFSMKVKNGKIIKKLKRL